MVPAGNETQDEASRKFFSAESKCCTYYPRVPNYLVGGLLADPGSHLDEGRRRLERIIDRRIGVTPRGISAPRKYSSLYRMGVEAFGKAQTLVCPYFERERGTCTVWDHRGATCSTYFCKFNAGKDGWKFWEALRQYLAVTEQILASYVLDRMGWTAESILKPESDETSLDANELDDIGPGDEAYASIWGEWIGREKDLFHRAYHEVRSLDRDTFERIGGVDLSLRLKMVQERYSEMMSPQLPDVLIRNPDIVVHPAGAGFVLVQGYGPVDPRRMRMELYQLLYRFDGTRPWRDVVSDIRSEGEEVLTEKLVIQLYQHRMLVGS
jgi:hypothetical protein